MRKFRNLDEILIALSETTYLMLQLQIIECLKRKAQKVILPKFSSVQAFPQHYKYIILLYFPITVRYLKHESFYSSQEMNQMSVSKSKGTLLLLITKLHLELASGFSLARFEVQPMSLSVGSLPQVFQCFPAFFLGSLPFLASSYQHGSLNRNIVLLIQQFLLSFRN